MPVLDEEVVKALSTLSVFLRSFSTFLPLPLTGQTEFYFLSCFKSMLTTLRSEVCFRLVGGETKFIMRSESPALWAMGVLIVEKGLVNLALIILSPSFELFLFIYNLTLLIIFIPKKTQQNKPMKRDPQFSQPGQAIQEDFTMRDDVIQLSNDIVVSARNKFRKRGAQGTGSGQLVGELRGSRKGDGQGLTARTAVEEEGRKSEEKGEKVSQSSKRDIFTSANSNHRYRGSSSFKISKTQSMQIDKLNKVTALSTHAYGTPETPFTSSQDLLINSQRKSEQFKQLFKSFEKGSQGQENSYFKLERKHNKANVKDSGVQGWLNQALIEASPNLMIDKNEENAGLKAYSIDRSALLRLGINPENVSRLYRSFFVYSLGFNNLLKDLCHENKDLRNSIWRVFAVLLEYCSGGNFETMIGQIERDKQNKLSQMRLQIQKRQQIIQNNDQLSQQKNAKITKQIRQLQEKTKDLLNQRENILQDYHEAEQAFNQEIALRLRYQTKINQIHGVYEELSLKYRLLREENQKNLGDMGGMRGLIQGQRVQLADCLAQLQDKTLLISNLESEKACLLSTLQSTQKSSKTSSINYLSAKHTSENFSHSLAEKSRKIQQLQLTIKSMKASEKSLLLTLKSKSDQFQRAMKENAELHQNGHRNVVVIGELMEKVRVLGHGKTEIAAEMALVSRKLEDKDQMLMETKDKLEKAQAELAQKSTQLQAQVQKSQSLQADLQSCHNNISQMKKKQNELHTILDESNTKITLLTEALQTKQQEHEKYILQIETLKNRIQEHKTEIKQKQSKIATLEEGIKGQREIFQGKLGKLQGEFLAVKELCARYEKERDRLFNEIQANKEKYEKVYIEFKNERFERNNLDLYYKQSLAVMEQQIEHIKKLNIKISQLTETIQDGKRKYSTLEMIHKHKTELLENDVGFWKAQFKVVEGKVKEREGYVHPMLYEDLWGCYRRCVEKGEGFRSKAVGLEKKVKDMEMAKVKYEMEVKNANKKPNDDSQKHLKNQLSKRDSEITFLKQKLQYQSQKLTEAQQLTSRALKQKSAIAEQARKAQTQLMQKISEKSKELQDLNQKYRSILQLNESQLKQNQRLAHKHEEERTRLLHRIEELSHELKGHQNRLRSPVKNNGGHGKERHGTKQDHVQHQHHGKKGGLEHREIGLIERHHGDGEIQEGWAGQAQEGDEEELEKLESKEELLESPSDPNLESASAFKKRESMRKKIKGAYLYYRK